MFKKSSERVGKTGEKEWKDVIEQQGYVLDEVVKMHEEMIKDKGTHQRMGSIISKHGKTQSDFEIALSDFNFCLNRALDTVVSQDMSDSHRQQAQPRMSDSELKKSISGIIAQSQASIIEDSRTMIPKLMGAQSAVNYRFGTIYDVKTLCNKVIKILREDLASANTVSIKIINADVIDYESN